MSDDEVQKLRAQVKEDRKLIQRAADVLAYIDRSGPGLDDHQADVLAALRIRLEGKPRGSLEDLLGAVGDISGKKDIAEVLADPGDEGKSEWPVIEEQKRDWPGL